MPRPRPSRAVALLVSGAALLTAVAVVIFRPRDEGRHTIEERTFTAGFSREGRPIKAVQFGSSGRTGLMVIASIHGSEPAGTPLARHFMRWLRRLPAESEIRCDIVVVPIANPDGYITGERFNRAGIDLNRNFPADNRIASAEFGLEPLSEPESQSLFDLIERFDPAAIVAIHQPLACIDYDGPAEPLAVAMADVCDLPVRKLGSRPGSLGSYFGETLGRPIITLELPPNPPRDLWSAYGPALKTAAAAACE